MQKSSSDKLKEMNIRSLNDIINKSEYVDMMYKQHLKEQREIRVPVQIDKTTKQYQAALKYVNCLLGLLNKEPITDLTEFKKVDRLDIIKPEHKPTLNELHKDLFKHFDKIKCGYYCKNTPNFTLNILRGLCKQLGLELYRVRKDKWHKINDKSYKRTHMMYFIR